MIHSGPSGPLFLFSYLCVKNRGERCWIVQRLEMRGHMKRKEGFTLIEIIICMAIVGVLVLILSPSIKKASQTNFLGEYKTLQLPVSNNSLEAVADSFGRGGVKSPHNYGELLFRGQGITNEFETSVLEIKFIPYSDTVSYFSFCYSHSSQNDFWTTPLWRFSTIEEVLSLELNAVGSIPSNVLIVVGGSYIPTTNTLNNKNKKLYPAIFIGTNGYRSLFLEEEKKWPKRTLTAMTKRR